MRKLLITMALLAAAASGHAQAIIGKMYTIVPDYVNVYGVDPSNKKIPDKAFRASKDTKFTVTGFDDNNNIKLTFWRYKKPVSKELEGKGNSKKVTSEITQLSFAQEKKQSEELYKFDKSEGYIGSWANYKEFAMSPQDFNASCVPYIGSKAEFTWGVMTLPIKLRPGNSKDRYFSFEEKLNLGFVFGRRFQLAGETQRAINCLIGVGVANVRTDSLSMKSGITPAGTSTSAFSASIGALYAHGNFQVGISTGFDHIPGTLGRDWKYQGKPWIGISVGVSLFSNSNTQGGEGNNDPVKP